jgi:hypothetical protein
MEWRGWTKLGYSICVHGSVTTKSPI